MCHYHNVVHAKINRTRTTPNNLYSREGRKGGRYLSTAIVRTCAAYALKILNYTHVCTNETMVPGSVTKINQGPGGIVIK